jgi:hypothetical protein
VHENPRWSMLMLVKTTPLIATALLGFMTAQASSFEVDGYRAGMTVAETRRLAAAQGWQILYVLPSGGFATRRNRDLGPSFTFCRGRLWVHELNYPGGFPTFNRLIEAETITRGEGTYSAENSQYARGSIHSLMLSWNGQDTGSKIYIRFIQHRDGVLVHRTWSAGICAPLPQPIP